MPEWSTLLYRRILTLAILKYGLPDPLDTEFTEMDTPFGGRRVPADLSDDDLLALYRLDELALAYSGGAASYRRVGKGAELKIENQEVFANATDEQQALMRSLDARAESHGDLGSSSGTVLLGDFEGLDEATEHFTTGILIPTLNIEGRSSSTDERMWKVRLRDPMNYVFSPWDLAGALGFLQLFDAELEERIGVRAAHLLGFIWSLWMHTMVAMTQNPLFATQILGTGYFAVLDESFDRFVDEVSYFLPSWMEGIGDGEELTQESAVSATAAAAAAWMYSESDFEQISLWDRQPFKIIVPGDGFYTVDLGSLPVALSGVMRTVGSLDGAAGFAKAVDFEDKVAGRLEEAGFEIWERQKRLKVDGTVEREIDVGVPIGNTLYVVECKALSHGFRIDRGEFGAMVGRRKDLEKHLDKARSLARVLEDHPQGRNYELPEGIDSVEYLVCTGGVEYIWSLDDALWFPTGVPRICSVDETVAYLKSLKSRSDSAEGI